MVSGLDLPIESWDLFADPSDDGSPSVGRPLDRVATSEALTKSTGARPIRLWGPSDRRFGFMTQEGQAANSIAFSCSGRFLATGGIEGRVKIHDATSGVLLRKIEVDPRGISAITFSADGSKVATSGPGPTRIWDVESGREVHRLGNVMSGSATLGFSPDGSKIAVANWDGTIVIWDLTTESPLLKLHTDHAQILSLAWSPDGKTLASGGYDSSVKVWELATPTLKTAAR
jgi:WD40 repeat protein